MNRELALELFTLIPTEAYEVIIKGRDTTEVFFTMPKEWRPAPEQTRITVAPQALQYHDKSRVRGRRWKIS